MQAWCHCVVGSAWAPPGAKASFSREFLLPILTMTNDPAGWGVDVDKPNKPNKPQQTSEGEATPGTPPVAPLQARSPYRPLSRRKRLEQIVDPPAAVERPPASNRFDASPTTISAALAKNGASPEESLLTWGADRSVRSSGDDDLTVEVDETET